MTQNNSSTIQDRIKIKHIPYAEDLAKHYFATIEHQPWAMLLRSAADGHPNNRYDILVANPIAKLLTHGSITTIYQKTETREWQTQQSEDDPFTLLAHYQQQLLLAQPSINDVPFIGGALGYFGYDLGRRVEQVPSLAAHDIPTADMAIGLYEWAFIVDHQLKQAYFVGQDIKQHQAWLESQQTLPNNAFTLTSDWQSNMTKTSYIEKFNAIQEYLRSGDCYQINLAQRFSAEYQGSEWLAYQALEQSNHAPFSAFIRTDETTLISISPERFLEINKNELNQTVIETKPIKGTRPRSKHAEQDKQLAEQLKNAEKDQAENLMIVDLLRNDIGRVAKPGSVTVPELFAIESFPAVHHLVSTIRAILDKDQCGSDLLRACFPGGSITGAPKIRAMEIIEELEPHRRNAYCGSIGYISRCGRMDTNITIRTLVAYQQHLYAWAGGGIVADSESESEYQETLDKISRILPTLSSL